MNISILPLDNVPTVIYYSRNNISGYVQADGTKIFYDLLLLLKFSLEIFLAMAFSQACVVKDEKVRGIWKPFWRIRTL